MKLYRGLDFCLTFKDLEYFHQPESLLQWDDWFGGWGERSQFCVFGIQQGFCHCFPRCSHMSHVLWTRKWDSEVHGSLRSSAAPQRPAEGPQCAPLVSAEVDSVHHPWSGRWDSAPSAGLRMMVRDRVVDKAEGCAALSQGINRLEKWTERNLMGINKEKCKARSLWRNNCRNQHSPSSWKEKTLEVLLDTRLDISQ